jgi:threonine/homoserine/homoserine lactone efflux protein
MYLLEGIAIGFLLAMPVWPVGILCVRNTVTYGRRHGLVVGLGGASADIVYATIAALGVKLISGFVADHQHLIRLIGSIVLFVVGFFTFRSRPLRTAKSSALTLHARTYVSTFAMAITNPMTLVGYLAVFTMVGLRTVLPSHAETVALVAGVFIGALLWSLVLTSLAHLIKGKLTDTSLARVNRIAGSLLLIFGAVAFLGGIGIF